VAALKYCLSSALIAFLIALQPLCVRTYSLFFDEKAPLAFKTSLGRDAPIPQSLVWSPFAESLTFRFGALSASMTLTLQVLLWGILVYSLLRLLNSTFRLTSGVDWDKGVLTRTYMHTPPLIKVFLIAVSAAIPALLVNVVIQRLLGGSDLSIALRLIIAGAAIWPLFSRDGVAGDCEDGNYELPRDRKILYSLVFRGAVAGTGAFAILKLARINDTGRLFDFFDTLGGMGEPQWRIIVLISCGTAVVLGFAGTALAASLGIPNRGIRQRIAWLALSVCLLLSTAFALGKWLPGQMRYRYDYAENLRQVRPEGLTESADKLRRKLVLAPPEKPETVVVMLPDGPQVLNVVRGSVALLNANAASSGKIEAFLKQRDYLTSLSDPAFKTLHDGSSLNWDSEESLRIDYLKLMHCPDGRFMSVFVDKLRTCAATPPNLRYADLLADETKFAFQSRESIVTMGDIYARFGERKKAEAWYRRADIPSSRIDEILSERTMFSTGSVTGKLTLDGRPADGYRVGLFPSAMTNQMFQTMLVPGVFRPYWLRWVGPKTVTEPDGSFRIENIVAGKYFVIISGPGLKMRSFSRRFRAMNAPGEMFIAFGKPRFDLGTIAMEVQPRQTPGTPQGLLF
jgi:hypothetical protein